MTFELWLVNLAAAVGLSLISGSTGLLSVTHGACYGFHPTIRTVPGGALGFFILTATQRYALCFDRSYKCERRRLGLTTVSFR